MFINMMQYDSISLLGRYMEVWKFAGGAGRKLLVSITFGEIAIKYRHFG